MLPPYSPPTKLKDMMTRTPKLHLDMPFGEALERYAGTKASELYANIDAAKQKKPPGGSKKRPSGKKKSKDVLSFGERKAHLRNKGHA